jgi:cation:H+ antiporter
MWWILRFEKSHQPQLIPSFSPEPKELPLKTVYLRFSLVSAAIIGAGIWLSFIGDEMAATYGWQTSFVGSLFLAITTSLPELVVTVAALRLGAIDMAIADIMGSNMFNLALVTPVDLAYRRGPILASVSPVHLVTAVIVIIMNLLVIAGLRFRQKRKTFSFISWYGIALAGFYVFGVYWLFINGTGTG